MNSLLQVSQCWKMNKLKVKQKIQNSVSVGFPSKSRFLVKTVILYILERKKPFNSSPTGTLVKIFIPGSSETGFCGEMTLNQAAAVPQKTDLSAAGLLEIISLKFDERFLFLFFQLIQRFSSFYVCPEPRYLSTCISEYISAFLF